MEKIAGKEMIKLIRSSEFASTQKKKKKKTGDILSTLEARVPRPAITYVPPLAAGDGLAIMEQWLTDAGRKLTQVTSISIRKCNS